MTEIPVFAQLDRGLKPRRLCPELADYVHRLAEIENRVGTVPVLIWLMLDAAAAQGRHPGFYPVKPRKNKRGRRVRIDYDRLEWLRIWGEVWGSRDCPSLASISDRIALPRNTVRDKLHRVGFTI